jgi:maleylpyruvate isomerase
LLTQSRAIIEYLDETEPEPPWLPRAPADRARVRALALICAADIHPINNLRILRYLRVSLGADEAAVASWYRHWIEVGFTGIEPQLANDPRTGRFCHGDLPGMADIFLIPQVMNGLNYQLDMAAFPAIRRIYEAALELPAFQHALPANQADAE